MQLCSGEVRYLQLQQGIAASSAHVPDAQLAAQASSCQVAAAGAECQCADRPHVAETTHLLRLPQASILRKSSISNISPGLLAEFSLTQTPIAIGEHQSAMPMQSALRLCLGGL